MSYSIVERGSLNTLNYKAYFDDQNEKLNPIKQDIQKGKPRYINNCFPHHGYIWNYGAMPQTWEDPVIVCKHTQKRGDNDPIDVCEIGYKVQSHGTVLQVKVLGVIALIDEDETDWKVIAIDVNDPLAKTLNGNYRVVHNLQGSDGKPPNEFAFDGEAKDKAFALEIIKEANEQWKKLIQKSEIDASVSIMNTTLTGNSALVSQEEAQAIVEATEQFGSPSSVPEEVSKWDYVQL